MTSAVVAPLRSITALVAMVVPWPMNCTSPDLTPATSMTRLMPRTTVAARLPGSFNTFATCTSPVASCTRITSVKVPPTSMPILYIQAGKTTRFSAAHDTRTSLPGLSDALASVLASSAIRLRPLSSRNPTRIEAPR